LAGAGILARYGDLAGRVNVYLPYPASADLLAGIPAGFGVVG